MKKPLIAGLCALFSFSTIFCQEKDCSYLLKNSERYLTKHDSLNLEKVQAMEAVLKECIQHDSLSYYIKGKLAYLKLNFEASYSFIRKSSEQGHSGSMVMLATMLKDGRGCQQDLAEAYRWYEKSAALGNQQAIYSLGYFHMKGLGGAKQDYKKALDYFGASNWPMAKHWLAICYLKGYGTEKNSLVANKLLTENNIENSNFFVQNSPRTDSVMPIAPLPTPSLTELSIAKDSLFGTYVGTYFEFDWGQGTVQRNIPIQLTLSKDRADGPQYDLLVNGISTKGSFGSENGQVLFSDLEMGIEGLLVDHPADKNLRYQIGSMRFFKDSRDLSNGKLWGSFDGEIENWVEPLPPHLIQWEKLPEDTILELVASSLKVSPNPFLSEFQVSFELITNANVHINIYNTIGMLIDSQTLAKDLKKGTYQLEISSSQWISGNYILEFSINGKSFSKILVKK